MNSPKSEQKDEIYSLKAACNANTNLLRSLLTKIEELSKCEQRILTLEELSKATGITSAGQNVLVRPIQNEVEMNEETSFGDQNETLAT